MPGWLGPWEIIILVGLIVLLFGTKRLPEVGRSLGKNIREVKDATVIKDVIEVQAQTRKAVAELNPATHVKRAVKGDEPKPPVAAG